MTCHEWKPYQDEIFGPALALQGLAEGESAVARARGTGFVCVGYVAGRLHVTKGKTLEQAAKKFENKLRQGLTLVT